MKINLSEIIKTNTLQAKMKINLSEIITTMFTYYEFEEAQ